MTAPQEKPMTLSREADGPVLNTDREIWREREGDAYADSVHVTEGGGIGINCGGMVYVKPVRAWHALASQSPSHAGGAVGREEIARYDFYRRDNTLAPSETGDWVRYEDVLALLAQAGAKQEGSAWQPIETAPKDGTVVWVSNGFSMRVAFWRDGKQYEHQGTVGGGWRDFYASAGGTEDLGFQPAHWMPLPAPPSIAKQETVKP